VFASGDWLTLIDSQDRVLLYSISQGEQRWHFFGDNAAINPARSIVAVENGAGQVSIYDLNTGDRVEQLLFPASVATLAFSKDGKVMFALTTEQNYYLFDVSGFGKGK
jgi:Tol biopolymer transport system component